MKNFKMAVSKKVVLSIFTLLLITACGNNAENTKSAYSISVVDSIKNLPYLNDIDANETHENDIVSIYGGFRSQKIDYSYNLQENIIGNGEFNISYYFQSKETEAIEIELALILSLEDKDYSILPNTDGTIKKVEIDNPKSQKDYLRFQTIVLEPSSPQKFDMTFNLELNNSTVSHYRIESFLVDKKTQLVVADSKILHAYVHSNTTSTLKNDNAKTGNFLPNPNGFGFGNFGNILKDDILNSDLIAMYGQKHICYNEDVDNCVLTAFGTFKKEFLYNSQRGGQCYGFAVATAMLHKGISYKGKRNPSDFNPNISNAIELKQEDVRNFIAVKHVNQDSKEVAKIQSFCEEEADTLTEYQKILNGFTSDDPIAVLAFSDATGEGKGGHAVMPYAITQEANNTARIYIYDNNDPGKDDLYIEVNLDNGAWRYPQGAINAQAQSSNGYYGQGQKNSLCTIPLSTTQYTKIEDDIASEKTQVKFDLLGEDNSIRMLISKDDNHTIGYDFKSQKYVNTIEGAIEKKNFEGLPSSYIIPTTENSTDITEISTNEELSAIFEQMIGVDVGLPTRSEQNNSKLKLSMETVTSKYRSILRFEDISVDKNDTFGVGFHPSGRVLALGKDNGKISQAKILINFDNVETQQGVIHELTFKEIQQGVSVIVFSGLNGDISIFAIGEDTLIEFEKGVHYTIKSVVIDENGSHISEKQTQYQKINSGILLKLKHPSDSNQNQKIDSNTEILF